MNRRQLLLAGLGLPLTAAHAKQGPPQTQQGPPPPFTPEQRQRLQRLFRGGFLQGLEEIPQNQRPTRGLWLLLDAKPPFEGQRPPENKEQEAQRKEQETQRQELMKRLADNPTLDDFALIFNLQRTRVGGIATFMPRSMHVLSADKRLAKELPLAELAKSNPLTMLLGTLTDSQFRQLIGDGLTFADLDASQASLLSAALPRPLTAEPAKGQPDYKLARTDRAAWERAWKEFQDKKKTFTDREIQQGLRLRTFLHTSYSFSDPTQQGYGIGLRPTENDQDWAGKEWQLEGGLYQSGQHSKSLSDYFVQSTPAKLKRGELPWNSAALEASVSLLEVKTVREVVERMAAATRLSLFVDPRYGTRAVQAFGDGQQAAPSRDVARALALALCGTWRRVGEGFVLTHDLIGRAEYAALQKEIVAVWSRRMTEAAIQSGKRLEQLEWLKNIPFAPGDMSAPTHDLLLQSTKTSDVTWKDLPNRLKLAFEVQFDKYSGPPERMENESEEDADKRMGNFHRLAQRVHSALTDKSQVGLSAELQFAIELPDTGPMALGEAHRIPDTRWEGGPSTGVAKPVAIDPVHLTETTRALLIRADTPDEGRSVVSKAAALGFNTVYLHVFLNGRPAFATEALPSRTPDAKQTLAAAIAAGKEHGVAVWAALDLLRWRNDLTNKSPEPLPEGFVEDLSLLGETGSQTVKRRLAEESFENRWVGEQFYKVNPGSYGWVSPLDPKVRQTLTRLVTDLAKTEGLAGIAFQRTAMSGYIPLDYYYGLDNIEYGYLPEERLAYLRTGGGDPVDIGNLRYSGMGFSVGGDYINFDVKVPDFDSNPGDASLVKPWQDFRAAGSRTLMHELFAAIRSVSSSLPLTLRERTMERSFEPWTAAKTLNEITDLSADGDVQGKRANANTLVIAALSASLRQDGKRVLATITEARKEAGRGRSKGIVLELSGSEPVKALESIAGHFSPTGKLF